MVHPAVSRVTRKLVRQSRGSWTIMNDNAAEVALPATEAITAPPSNTTVLGEPLTDCYRAEEYSLAVTDAAPHRLVSAT